MKILVSNDDGVYAPGLKVLAEAMQSFGEVTVVAPDRDHSGVSNSLSLTTPLRLHTLPNGYNVVHGTPTDCVHLALTGFLTEKPDLVIAGINSGSNLGDDVIYSGTVAAAMEARFLGIPSIAVSLCNAKNDFRHYDTAAQVVSKLVNQLQTEALPSQTILNVNVPDIEFEKLQGLAVTRLGHRHLAEPVTESFDPRGNRIYWIGPAGKEQDAGPGTDFHAIRQNCAAITPLHVDLTRYRDLEQLTEWVETIPI